tara:strand:- start:41 stop:1324 length:1284 start_codon:yes stop_codon:yes gene_type:complete
MNGDSINVIAKALDRGKSTIEGKLKQDFVNKFYKNQGLGEAPDMSQYNIETTVHSKEDIAAHHGIDVSEVRPRHRTEYRRYLSELKKGEQGLVLDQYSKAKTTFRLAIERQEGKNAYKLLGRSGGGQINQLSDILKNEEFLDKYGFIAQESGLTKLENPNLQNPEAVKALREFKRLYNLEYPSIIEGEVREYDLTNPEDKKQLLKDSEYLATRTLESAFRKAGAAGQSLANDPETINMFLNEIYSNRIEELYNGVPKSQRIQLSHIMAQNDPESVGLLNKQNLFLEPPGPNVSRQARPLTEATEPEAWKAMTENQAQRIEAARNRNLLDTISHEGVFPESTGPLTNIEIPWVRASDKRLDTWRNQANQAAIRGKGDIWANQLRERLAPALDRSRKMYNRVGMQMKKYPGAFRLGMIGGAGGGGAGKY